MLGREAPQVVAGDDGQGVRAAVAEGNGGPRMQKDPRTQILQLMVAVLGG